MNELDRIRFLNANGPYEHGIWSSDNSYESTNNLSGTLLFYRRSFELVEKISSLLLGQFDAKELHELSILDVGCYDGWILHMLNERLNFKSAVGLEPRSKNLGKGVAARQFYGVESNVTFIRGTLGDAPTLFESGSFDIVLCLGMLHHVSSTVDSVKTLSMLTRDVLIIDSMVINPPKKDSRDILRLLNTKDIIYKKGSQKWATAAFKFESPYFDGSAAESLIVNVPESRLIEMSLSASNLSVIEKDAPEEKYYSKGFQRLRGVKEALILARVDRSRASFDWSDAAKHHEFCNTFQLIPTSVLKLWISSLDHVASQNHETFLGSNKFLGRSPNVRERLLFHLSRSPFTKGGRLLARLLRIEASQLELISNISRAPEDKILLEIVKRAVMAGDLDFAISAGEAITDKLGSDWRSFYRAAFLLSCIHLWQGNKVRSEEWWELLKTSNSMWPFERFNESKDVPWTEI